MDLKIIYEDNDLIVINKPAGTVVFYETADVTKATKAAKDKALIDLLIEKNPKLGEVGSPPRYGAVHRLDKDTSGILLVAKNEKSLIFFQKQFINREVEKKYLALVCGTLKDGSGKIETLIGRSPADPRKQKAYPLEISKPKVQISNQVQILNTSKRLREAITEYRVLQRFGNYILLEVKIKTGRKHQIRCHLAHIHHPIAGDKLYGFKDSPIPEGLKRQFLHAAYLKIKLPNGKVKEFESELPVELQSVIQKLKRKQIPPAGDKNQS